MIYIACALFEEAKAVIHHCGLKRQDGWGRLQVFVSENICLLLTGYGSFKASMAVTSWLEKAKPEADDIFVNMGIAASADKNIPVGSICLAQEIKSFSYGIKDGKTVSRINRQYPDLLYVHPFLEKKIVTLDLPSSGVDGNYIYDMEAAGVFEAACNYMSLHRIFIIKTVSDYGAGDNISPLKIEELMKKMVEPVLIWASNLPDSFATEDFSKQEQQEIQRVVELLGLSVSMENELRQKLNYLHLNNQSLQQIFKDMNLPCEPVSKREGKKYLERINQFI